ncbi:unnamed protein product [Prorocentrum cordatum]|uniref:Uncharacterized protein n=1 Tax=Prorocentrum cordatum TaxID=2364126 RepID=A0ABN9VM13_9DINO|nr:unnamed protein product [Polarella glacialis]
MRCPPTACLETSFNPASNGSLTIRTTSHPVMNFAISICGTTLPGKDAIGVRGHQSTVTSSPAQSQSAAAAAEDVRVIEHFVANKAVSKALARAHAPMRFAQGDDVPRRLQDMFPRPARPLLPQPAHEEVPAELREELVTHIAAAVTALPSMCGAGPNGSFSEHLKIHAFIQGGLQVLAGVLAELQTSETPVEAARASRSARCHSPLKPDPDVDIRPLVSPSGHWRAALRGWGNMFSEAVRKALGESQCGVARPGGPVARQHFVEAHSFSDPELALAALDVANMHGSMCLGNIESEVRHRVPRTWPLVSRWLRLERRHAFKNPAGALHEIIAAIGVDQGCPLLYQFLTAPDNPAYLSRLRSTVSAAVPGRAASGSSRSASAPRTTSASTRPAPGWWASTPGCLPPSSGSAPRPGPGSSASSSGAHAASCSSGPAATVQGCHL